MERFDFVYNYFVLACAAGARKQILLFYEWTLHTLQLEGVQAITDAEDGARIVFEFGDAEVSGLDDVTFGAVE